ncbi:hypothetical protein J5N97_001556 [Dioscorea zingiberensis]|uniref:GDP-fucose protein O-fucosyltransferase 2 n=1 Tax=Dioscorea zingiberensis TaxID=325984 RepID=A0A9D5BTS6_9LILI|nr:hypothetical protein J5N97_001556 [Dioscorea zingiberensis]
MARDHSSGSSSEDEEEDLHSLIPQNETKPPPRRFASFEIDANALKSRLSRGFSGSRRYLLALLLLPVIFIFVYFFVDFGRVSRAVSAVRADTPADLMRESELHALFLLRNQQVSLLRLWNRTLAAEQSGSGKPSLSPSPPPTLNSNSSLEEFRSAVLDQIRLNKQIQKALLSSHRAGNASVESPEDNVGLDLSGFGVDICKKVERPVERRAIEWRPRKDRFLFAICTSGQMSNHLICLEKHMFFAALLERTLILPSPKFDYQYDRVLDINHINECFGRKVVITFDEFSEMKKKSMRIDRFICYMASPPCYVDDEHLKKLKNLGISLGKIDVVWPEDAKSKVQKQRVAGDITGKFLSNDEVIAVGDLFYADVEDEWVMQPGGPLAHKCKTTLQPSRIILLTAQRFVQTFLGGNFIALHFRRHGFLKFCNAKDESCFYPVPQAAECILRVVEKANAPVIYLSTDAADSETNLLQSMVVLNEKTIPLIKRPDHTSVEKWDALLYRNRLGGDTQVEAMLDKTICALSSVFIGSSGSTFTDDISRLRRAWGSASHCDEPLCQGELPNFIAEQD